MHPLIITCAITGAEVTKTNQPNLPITPKDQAKAARDAVKAGASVIHLHVREDDGSPSQRVERFEEAIHEIRLAVPEVIVQISTGGAVGEPIANRIKPLELRPEMASLNMGTMNFGDDVFENRPQDIAALAQEMTSLGIVPELEIYEAGHLEASFRLIQKGILKAPFHYQFVLGVPGGMSGDVRNLIHLKSMLDTELGADVSWAVAGIGRFQLPIATHALLMGGHVRVGFEDNIFYTKGVLAKSNAQLVERVSRLANELGRGVASPAEARAMLEGE